MQQSKKPTPPAPATAALEGLTRQRAQALGLNPDTIEQLLRELGQDGPALIRLLLELIALFKKPAPTPVTEAPGCNVDHAGCCDRCLEHLLAAAAICMHHRHCSEQEQAG